LSAFPLGVQVFPREWRSHRQGQRSTKARIGKSIVLLRLAVSISVGQSKPSTTFYPCWQRCARRLVLHSQEGEPGNGYGTTPSWQRFARAWTSRNPGTFYRQLTPAKEECKFLMSNQASKPSPVLMCALSGTVPVSR